MTSAVVNNVFQCKGYRWNLAKHGTTQSGTWQVEHCIQDLLLRVFVLHNRHLWNLDNSAGICTPTEQARTLYRRCHQIFWMQRMFDRLMGVAQRWLLIICCPFVRPDEEAHRDNSLDDRHESHCIKLFKLDMPLFCLGRKRRVLNVALLVAGVCGGTVCQMASRSKMPPHVWSLGTRRCDHITPVLCEVLHYVELPYNVILEKSRWHVYTIVRIQWKLVFTFVLLLR